MNAGELYDAFREDVVDTQKPYLWSDREVWRYMNDAHRTFVRLTGGIADVSSKITSVPVVAGEYRVDLSELIVRIDSASLVSTGSNVVVTNEENLWKHCASDYGQISSAMIGRREGPVTVLVIGREDGLGELLNVPVVDDEIQLRVHRLPLVDLKERSDKIEGVNASHHDSLLIWMKHKAYGKHDADTFDKGKSDEFENEFRLYCAGVKSDIERLMVKSGTVSYGGL